jgi:peroxiredoxin
LEESKIFFESKDVYITAISTDNKDSLKKMVDDKRLSFPVLCDESLRALKAYGVFYHSDNDPYEDHGEHGEPAYFLVDETGRLLYQQKQTGPFGRPSVIDLRKTVQYIKKNLKPE